MSKTAVYATTIKQQLESLQSGLKEQDHVYRTIDLYKSAREARTAAERDVTRLRQQLEEREEEVETLRREMVRLRKEREEIRGRVEKMLAQIETLTEEQAAS